MIIDPPAPLRSPPLTALGLISYGVYLWQVPVIWALDHAGALSIPAAALISVAIATASYWIVERPFLRRRASRPLLSQEA